jgi:hypothetical protein
MVGVGGSFTSWVSWVACLGLLTGAWAVVAVAAGSQLPSAGASSGASVVSMDGPMTVRRDTYPLWVERKPPCTGEVISLDLLLTLEVKSKLDGEWASFAVQAWLASNDAGGAVDQIAPAQAHFGFSSPRSGQAGHVYRLQTPVLGLTAPVELTVPLEQGVDRHSQLIVQPGQIELTCG